MTDRVFDRIPRFDEASRSYGITALVGEAAPRSMTWSCDLYLDQGPDGACVGHAFAHDANARPVVRRVDSAGAFGLYHRAQVLDEWPGEAYSGTSVLAGAKAYVEAGFATGYHWAFSLAQLVLGLGHEGPAILGINWRAQMMDTNAEGFVKVAGSVVGGHAILARQVHLVWRAGTTTADKHAPDWFTHVDTDRSWIRLHQSWGGAWGQAGTARVTLRDVGELLADSGEVCFPSGRR